MERKSPSLEGLAVDGDRLLRVIDLQRRGAADADLAHLPGDERRVRRDAASRGENAFGRDHAAQIFRAEVSLRTSRTFSPFSAAAAARSALK